MLYDPDRLGLRYADDSKLGLEGADWDAMPATVSIFNAIWPTVQKLASIQVGA
jgi:hypothetical protein